MVRGGIEKMKFKLTHKDDTRFNKIVEADSFYVDESKTIVFSVKGKHVAAYLGHGFVSVVREDFEESEE